MLLIIWFLNIFKIFVWVEMSDCFNVLKFVNFIWFVNSVFKFFLVELGLKVLL